MVSAKEYFSTLAKAVMASQVRWRELLLQKTAQVNALKQTSASDKMAIDNQLNALRNTLNEQAKFLGKVQRHIAFFNKWGEKTVFETLNQKLVKSGLREMRVDAGAIASIFGAVKEAANKLSAKISEEIGVVENASNANFASIWGRFLTLYAQEQELHNSIEESTVAGQEYVEILGEDLRSLAEQLSQKPAQPELTMVSDVLIKTIVCGTIMYILSSVFMSKESLDYFGGVFQFSAASATGTALFEFARMAIQRFRQARQELSA